MRRASLLVRFAAVSVVLTALLGVLLAQLLAGMIERRGLESAKDAAVLATTVGIQPLLGHDRLDERLPQEAATRLDQAVRASRGGVEVARIKIWNRDERLLYTVDPHTVAAPSGEAAEPSHELAEALEGHVEAELITDSEESDNAPLLRRYGSLLEVYVPIQYDGQAAPVGVFELYLPYEPVAASIRADTTRAYLLLALGLVVLWLGLFRTVASASASCAGRPSATPTRRCTTG